MTARSDVKAHTAGPWTVFEQSWSNTAVLAGDECICALDINHATEDTQEALEAVMAANARRIVACVNAMEGLSNEQVSALRASHAELLAALLLCLNAVRLAGWEGDPCAAAEAEPTHQDWCRYWDDEICTCGAAVPNPSEAA